MAFFQSAVGTLQTLVVALGAGLDIFKQNGWRIIFKQYKRLSRLIVKKC